MEDESIQKDEEKLKSLLETLKKNDENVPEELLKTKYKKPYRELKDSIKEVADQISGRRIRQDIVIKNDDAGQVLIKQIQEMLEEKRRTGTGKELGRTLYKEYSVEKFLQVVEEIRIPPSSSAKQCHFPVFRSTENELARSSWNGHRPVRLSPVILCFLITEQYSVL